MRRSRDRAVEECREAHAAELQRVARDRAQVIELRDRLNAELRRTRDDAVAERDAAARELREALTVCEGLRKELRQIAQRHATRSVLQRSVGAMQQQ